MSSIMACSSPPPAPSMPFTRRGVLSSESMPMDWASRRAGSMVRTTTLRPRSAARTPERRRGRRLADAARAAAHDDAGVLVVEQRVDVQGGGGRNGRGCCAGVRVLGGTRLRTRCHEPTPCPAPSPTPCLRSSAARSYSPARSTPSPSSGSSCVGRSEIREHGPLLALQLAPARRARRPARAAGPPAARRPPRRAPPRPAADERLGDLRAAAARRGYAGGLVQEMRPHHVHDDPAHRQFGRPQLGDAVRGLLDRHLLQQRHQVHRRLGRLEHPHHGLRLIVYRADLGQPRHLVVHVQEAGDAAGRRRVHDHVVVGEPPALVLAAYGLAGLAGQQHVPQAGRDGGGEVDRAELLQRPARAAELVEHLEVVQKGRSASMARAYTSRRPARRRSSAPRTAGPPSRRAARCPACPRPRRGGCACPRSRGRARVRRRPWSYRYRPCR